MNKFTRKDILINGYKSSKYLSGNGISLIRNNQTSTPSASNSSETSSPVMRDIPGLIKPSYKQFSYAMSQTTGLHLLCDTVGDRINILAKERPNDVGFKFCLTQTSFTFLDLKQRTEQIAQNLLNLGFKKGDRLAVLLPNIPEINLTIWAAASIGVVIVLMNPAYQQVEVEYMLKKTKAKGIVMLDNLKTLQHYEILRRICPELEHSSKGELNSSNLPDLKHVIIANNRLFKDANQQTKGTWNFNELIKFDRPNVELPKVNMDDSFVILFTSGTTGFPKGAVLSHHTLLNSAFMEIVGPNLVEENKVICCPIPIFHIFGLIVGSISPFVCGGKAIMPHIFPDTLATLKAIHAEKCTSIKAAPVIYIDLLNHPERKNYDLSSLQYMLAGASTVPKDLALKLKKELNFKHVLIGCGMTESGSSGLVTRPRDAQISEKVAYESIGQPFPFVECKIIDSDGNLAPVNTDGEICLRGYNVMKGYWDEPIKTAETIDENGWLKTGDIGSMDEQGYVYFKSRAKEVIIRGGVNVYPAEIESFIRTHPDVFDAYCFGLSDPRVGEEVCLWIRLNPNAKMTQQNVIDYCQGKVAFFKIPKYIKFVQSFPVNANGKVQKFKMAAQMEKEISSQSNN